MSRSIAHIEASLQQHAPVHGIAGICDGSIMAAAVVSRRPPSELELFINFCGGPPSQFLQPTRVQASPPQLYRAITEEQSHSSMSSKRQRHLIPPWIPAPSEPR